MSSMKQLLGEIPGDETAGHGHAMITGSFRGARSLSGEPWGNNLRVPSAPTTGLGGKHASKQCDGLRQRRPSVTVCHDFGIKTVKAVLRRRLAPQCRVLLRVDRLPSDLGLAHRVILAGVDTVVVASNTLARMVHAFGVPASRIVLLADRDDLALFDQPAHPRASRATRCIIYVGDLEPEAGVADLLHCIVAWAERNPLQNVEVSWCGEGCLRGVLEAQPLRANVNQEFPGRVARDELATMFMECDILAAPTLTDFWDDVILEALTARLPVLGSARSRAVTDHVTEGITGWIFDPFKAGAMDRAVDLALSMSPEQLDTMRAQASTMSRSPRPGLNERIWRALHLDGTGLAFDAAALGLAS